ncbi:MULTISPECIES: FAD-dependent thymidylate synthase [Nocardia]|uniref:FAD-dependent thymidylate synthase n=1 Tax=Nocardia TaxID=1817 RepID=UPI001300B715|nr:MULTISPECIES: FAD-dependent thymidylate synthase [Nocardia]
MAVFVTPKVELVGSTLFEPPASVDYDLSIDAVNDGEELAQFAGRACYQSFHRPVPETATAAGYMDNILRKKDLSILEHAHASYYLTGISRSFSHEMVRHRHISPSQLSQRFVDDTNVRFVIPPLYQGDDAAIADLNDAADFALERYRRNVDRYLEKGVARKQAREAAREFLPNMTETKMVLTGNYRAWLEFLTKRDTELADAQIHRIAEMIGAHLAEFAPNIFDDRPRSIWQPERP